MKNRKCEICKERDSDNRHAKDYNHANLKASGNCVNLCLPCHEALHQLNHKNNLEWNYMMTNKKEEIIKLSESLAKRRK